MLGRSELGECKVKVWVMSIPARRRILDTWQYFSVPRFSARFIVDSVSWCPVRSKCK